MYKYFPVSAASKMSVVLLLAMSPTLAACSSGELALDDTYVASTHYERYPIEVTKAPVKLQVSSRYGTLQSAQINMISGFARSARNSSSSRITISRPSGGGASSKVARETYQLLVQSGISPGMIVQKTYPGSSKGTVQISYLRSVAVTKECGDWSSDLTNTSNNEPYPNLGCSVQSNIAAMVVNPDNFVVPEPTAPALAASRQSRSRSYAPY
jgi:pilus assembly protein CpaD